MNYEIKRINVWSVIKIVFLISFCLGALIGVFYALFLSIVTSVIQNLTTEIIDTGFGSFSGIGIFFVIIATAFFIAISNTIFCAFFICVYNITAQWSGGFKVELAPLAVDHKIENLEAPSSVKKFEQRDNNFNESGG